MLHRLRSCAAGTNLGRVLCAGPESVNCDRPRNVKGHSQFMAKSQLEHTTFNSDRKNYS